MNINDNNIINRWQLMASKDLGIDVNPLADEFYRLFKEVLTSPEEEQQIRGYSYINPILRGYKINNPYEEINVVECLNLNHIDITKEAIRRLDWYLMNYQEWFGRYQYACNN